MDNSGKSSVPLRNERRDMGQAREAARVSLHNSRSVPMPKIPSTGSNTGSSELPKPNSASIPQPEVMNDGVLGKPAGLPPFAPPANSVSTQPQAPSVSEPEIDLDQCQTCAISRGDFEGLEGFSSVADDLGINPYEDESADVPAVDSSSTPSGSVSSTPSGSVSSGVMPSKDLSLCPEDLANEPAIELESVGTSLPVGMKIDDRYEILGTLGVGGFATVYKAHHLTIDRDVALKVMDLKKGVDPSYSQRFFREAKIAAKIHHNNVVSIYDFGHVAETGQPYIAMEMLHGHDLSHELTEAGPLSPKRAFVLFRPVLEALGQGHRLGIVHKDLKPENLYLVDPRGQRELMKVLDFGVARINSSEVAKLTSAGQLLGTPRYLAPEYIKQQLVSPAIDVYQMALIISEALTGVPAVSGDPFHAMMLHCSGKLQISEFLLEGRLGEVFRKAIHADPAQRYPDCDAFAAALDSVADCFASTTPLKGGAPQLTPDSRTSSKLILDPFATNINTGESVQISAPYKKKKNSLPIIIAILLIMVCAGLVIFFVISQKQAEMRALEEAQKAEEVPVKVYAFNINTTPEDADIKLKGGSNVLCTTPCKHEFEETGLPATITITKEGYQSAEIELSKLLFETEDGNVTVELAEEVEQITELEFTLTYKPETAAVIEKSSNEKVCTKSPCQYIFQIDKGYAQLTFSAPGYKPKSVTLAKPLYDENNGAIEIILDKEVFKPQVKKPTPAKSNDSAPAPKHEAPPSPKEEKKPEIMLL